MMIATSHIFVQAWNIIQTTSLENRAYHPIHLHSLFYSLQKMYEWLKVAKREMEKEIMKNQRDTSYGHSPGSSMGVQAHPSELL